MSDDENDLRSFIRGGTDDRGSGGSSYRSSSRPTSDRHDRDSHRDRERDRDRDRDSGRDRDRDRGRRRSPSPHQDNHRRGPPPSSRPRRDEDDGPLPEMYSIHKGKVMSIQSFGVFVQMEGFRKQGLVHVSHISKHRVEDPKGVVNEGDPVWVKVVSLEDADGRKKIGLSMKFVNQTDGHDLDINNVDLMMSQKKTRPLANDRKPIEFGHALPTTCAKCGSAGHYTKECYSSGEKYELIPDDDGRTVPGASSTTAANPPAVPMSANSEEFKRKVAAWEAKYGSGASGSTDPQAKKQKTDADDRHHKKDKKHKKEKKDKHHKKEKKHHKKHKKEKKHKRDSSSSSSSSDSSSEEEKNRK